uniref:Lens fiber membrane intrinsic protein n=2 Tax=Scleropages formosus TaxID=113540 RepID=A0A8C9S2J1_SCLFO
MLNISSVLSGNILHVVSGPLEKKGQQINCSASNDHGTELYRLPFTAVDKSLPLWMIGLGVGGGLLLCLFGGIACQRVSKKQTRSSVADKSMVELMQIREEQMKIKEEHPCTSYQADMDVYEVEYSGPVDLDSASINKKAEGITFWNSAHRVLFDILLPAAITAPFAMYSFMGGGLFCAIVGNILLVVSTATDYWMQYRLSGNFAHQGLWRYCMSNKCYMQTDSIAYWNATRAFMIMSAMSCFGGIIAGILSFAHFSTFERFNRSFAAGIMFFISTFFVLLAMAIYTGVTVNFLGKRFGDWRFSWSYVLGWVALLMTFFAGMFYMCAFRMHECRRVAGSR